MGSLLLVRIATAEALLVLTLGIAVLMRGGEEAPPSMIVDRVAHGPRTEQAGPRIEPPVSKAAEPIASMAAQLPPEPDSATASVDEGDPLGLVLYGAVQDQDGNPLTGWAVSLSTADKDNTQHWRATGGRFPTWSLSGIAPGNYHLRCQLSSYQTIEEDITLLPTPRVQRRDFRLLRSLAIKVKFDVSEELRAALAFDRHAVLASDEELPGRIPILDGGNIPFRTLGSWQSNYDGSLGKEYAGQILLKRAPPLHLNVFLGPIRLQSQYLAEMCDEVTFTIDAKLLREAVGSLRLRLVDASTGLPVVTAFVNVANGQSSPNEQGVLERNDLVPGRQDLQIWTQNRYAVVSRSIEIRGGERLDLGEIQLTQPRTLHGIAVDPAGQGVVAQLNAVSLDDPEAPEISSLPYAQSRADGRFDLAGLGTTRYLLRAFTADRGHMGLTTVATDTATEVRIVLLPTYTVEFASHLGAYEECRATVRTVEGHALHDERLMGPRTVRLPLPEGTYLVDLLGAGRNQRISFTVTQRGAKVEVR